MAAEDISTTNHDVIIVGAGVAGSAMAVALGNDGRKVLLLERDLSEPDRIVGELLQPGGMKALRKLGLEGCVDDIDAIPVYGYGVFYDGQMVEIPYIADNESVSGKRSQGRSFHHGRFIMNLRKAARATPNVTIVEATVNDLIRDEIGNVIGAIATPKEEGGAIKTQYYAPLTVVADGCFSKFRKEFVYKTPIAKSSFVGFILKDCPLPLPNHGHVVLAHPSPVLLYQIGAHETRVLVDVPGKLPSASSGALKTYMQTVVAPELPQEVQHSFLEALETEQLRSMPNSWLPPSTNNTEGLLLLGDAMNMRHPLTGGGMTVALNDVVILRELLHPLTIPSFTEADMVLAQMSTWHWRRKYLSSVINVLAQALYSLFGAGDDDEDLIFLREACFRYFQLGGECIDGPVGLLSGLTPRPMVLIGHFFAVAIYGVYLLWCEGGWKDIPGNFLRSFSVLCTACIVILPVLWTELQV